MKIVYIYKSMVLLAGMERILSNKMNLLAEQYDYEIIFVTYEQGNNPISFQLSPKIKHHNLDYKFYQRYKYGFIKRNLYLYKMKKLFQKELSHLFTSINPDIIITTTYEYHLLDNIYKSYPKAKFILESHVAKETEMTSSHITLPILHQFAQLWDFRMKQYINKFNCIVTLTSKDKASWEKFKNVIVIPNMITYPLDITHTPSKRIISVGRLNHQKGFDILIDVWKSIANKYPDWSIHIYGDGELKESLLEQISKYGLTNSIFIHPATSDIYKKYQEHEFYIMTSRYEGFGLVLVEAMSYGLPCISFDCPCGPSEIITNNIDGFLVSQGNKEDLAHKIEFLIGNHTQRYDMGNHARINSKRFCSNNIIQSWNQLFSNL